MYRESMNERIMWNPFENDCESLWGTAEHETTLAAATVRLYGDRGKVRRV